MGLPAFDTLHFVETLQQGGFSEQQAKSLSAAQRLVLRDALDSNVATKADMVKLEADIAGVKSELKADITRVESELKTDMTRLESEISHVKTELKAEIAHTRTESAGKFTLINWMVGFTLTLCIAILAKLFLH